MEIKEIYEIVNNATDGLKEIVSNQLGFISEKLDTIIECQDDSEDDIAKLKDRVKDLEYKVERIECTQKETDSKITKLQDFFERKISELKNLITSKKLSWPKIVSLILGILASPAVLLLLQALLKAKGWL